MKLGYTMLFRKKKKPKKTKGLVTVNMKSLKKQNLYCGLDLAPKNHSLEPKLMKQVQKVSK